MSTTTQVTEAISKIHQKHSLRKEKKWESQIISNSIQSSIVIHGEELAVADIKWLDEDQDWCPTSLFEIIISFLGDARGEAPGGYLHLNKDFEIVGRWENSMGDIPFSYDFWYQPRHNVMVSSEWAAPNTFMPGFDLEEVGHLKYGRRLHVWDFKKKEPVQTMY